jgi:diacylglycerol O-acyltransferase / wax synthase
VDVEREDSFPRRLSGADELMWRIEADPVLRSPVLVVGLLDREPRDQRVRATLASWQEELPRLRQRLVTGPRPFGGAHWVPCDDNSLDFHVRRVRVPDPADIGAVLGVVEPTVTAPFDVARPLWELTVVDGVAGGRAAFALRFHHTVTDGVGGIELARQLFDHTRGGRGPRTRRGSASAARTSIADRLLAVAQKACGVTRLGVDAARHPVATVQQGRRLAASVARGLAPGPPGSPVFGSRGLNRRLDVLEAPLARFEWAADRIGCTINDVFLAAVGGALRRYHDVIGRPVAVVRCTMPINLRDEGDPRGGNRFAPARFTLPVDDPDPAARARIAGAIARRWRSEPALAWTGAISAALDALPSGLTTRLLGSMLKSIDVDVVNVTGLRRPAYIAGARVERLWAFAPPTGAALSVTLLSHLDTCCISLMCDRQAVARPELVRACLEESLDEVLARGSPTIPITRPA